MKIFVNCLSSSHFLTLEVNPTDSILQLKTNIEHKEGFNIEDQFLSYKCKPLNDSKLLSHYEVQDESTINLSLRLRGGMKVHSTKELAKASIQKKRFGTKNSGFLRKKSSQDEMIRQKKDLLPEGCTEINDLIALYLAQKEEKLKKKVEEWISLKEESKEIQKKNSLFFLGVAFTTAISKDKRFIIYGLESGSIKVFDAQKRQPYHYFENIHTGIAILSSICEDLSFIGAVSSVVISHHNRFIVSGSYDKSIKVFDLQTKQPYHHFQGVHAGNFPLPSFLSLVRRCIISCYQ